MKTQTGLVSRSYFTADRFAFNALALAVSGALLATPTSADDDAPIELDQLTIEETITPDTNPYAVPGAPYLADTLSDPRRTRPISETPQTITVLTSTEIEDSGRSDLREILDGQPGITLGTGENGNAFGDRYVIRGHEARSDVFVDGMRDVGMTIRESFAVEQVEISKGPSSSFAGRGTTGGAVNTASKRASTEYDFTDLSAGLGTDNHYRAQIDTNQVLRYDTAVRANVLYSTEDVPEREPANRERLGAALSVTNQPTDKLEVTADYYHFQGQDKPDLGAFIDRETNDVQGDVPVYLQDEDFLESMVNTGTLRIGYEIAPRTRLVNLTRYGQTENGYLMTGARGTTAYATEADATNGVNGYDSISLSTHQGWQDVEYFANQLNLLSSHDLFGMTHDLVFGLEYSDQKVLNGVYDLEVQGSENCFSSGRRGVSESFCIIDANGNTVSDVNSLMQRDVEKGDWDSDWQVKTLSLSAMDTVDLTEKVTTFAGIRYDYYDFALKTQRAGDVLTYENQDGLLNGHFGTTLQLTDAGNVYASVSTATNINGGESDVGTSCGYGGVCTGGENDTLGDPEKTLSLELGTKWQFNDGKFLASAAVFQITKDDVMESVGEDDYADVGTVNTGKNQVQGVELGLSGSLTDKLSLQAGLAVMKAEVLESIDEDNVGKTLANFADNSASLQAKYQLTPNLSFGAAATYEGERFVGQPDSAANEDVSVPAYTVYDAFATYDVTRNLSVRANIGNLTDEEYYLAAYRSGSFAYIGDRRNIQLNVNYSF